MNSAADEHRHRAHRVALGIAGRICRHRKSRGLTQRALADLAGMKPGAIAHYEAGRSTPSVEALLVLAFALGVEPGALLTPADVDVEEE